MIYILKNIFLFPFRLALSLLWFLWFLAFGGLYPGCAPIFWNNDRYVLYLKRKRFNRYCVVLYDLAAQAGEIIYQRMLPIEKISLKNNNELVCCSYTKGEILYVLINLNEWKKTKPQEYNLIAPSKYDYSALPKSVGLISKYLICSDEDCYRQIVMITDSGHEVLENNIEDDIGLTPTISNDEKYFSYSSVKGIYISNVSTKKQSFYPEGESSVYNWDNNCNLLAYSIKNNYFLLLNPISSERKVINLPDEFKNKRVTLATISTKGNFIVYAIAGNVRGTTKDNWLILQSVHSKEHKVLAAKAFFFGIGWSKNEKYISIAGVNKRDLFEISYQYKMRNATNHDKEVIDVDGIVIMQSSKARIAEKSDDTPQSHQ